MRPTSFLLTTVLILPLAAAGCSSDAPTAFVPNHARLHTPASSSQVVRVHLENFLDGRGVWVYLPPGYRATTERYPVLYMHDGQSLFGLPPTEWDIASTCDQLIRAQLVRPAIIVAIANDGENRAWEYTPFHSPFRPNANEGGGHAYLETVVAELKPAIDKLFRSAPDRHNTIIAGASLGGLISVYAGYEFDHVFGSVASFSGSFGWDNGSFWDYVIGSGRPELSRLYLDSGTVNDNYNSAVYMHEIAQDQGFTDGVDLTLLIGDGHAHSPEFWGARFGDMLQFLLPGPQAPRPGALQ